MGSHRSASVDEPAKLSPPRPAGALLDESGNQVGALLRQLPPIVLFDANLRFIAAERKASSGWPPGVLADTPLGKRLPPATAEYVRSRDQHALADVEVDFDFPFQVHGGVSRGGPIPGERGDSIATLAVAREATEQRREAQAQRFLIDASMLLASSLDYKAALAEVAKRAVPHQADWCLVCMQTGGQLEWLAVAHANPALAAKAQARLTALGRIPAGLARLLTSDEATLVECLSGEQLRKLATRESYLAALGELASYSAIFAPLVGHDGTYGGTWFLASATAEGGSGRHFGEADREVFGELARIAALAVENALLHEEAAARERQLQALIERQLAAQEEERRRIAHDVHDQLAQVAASAYQHLQVLAECYHPRSAAAKATLDQALELSRCTIQEARRVVAGLRPAALDDVGLVGAIGQLLDDLRAEGWEATYRGRLGGTRLPSPLETALFRVTQEALSNVRKHAGPTRIHVTLNRSEKWVRLEVRDWGRGFDPRTIAPATEPGAHMGLIGMRERVSLLGGRCDVISRHGKGTRVVAKAPLAPPCERASA